MFSYSVKVKTLIFNQAIKDSAGIPNSLCNFLIIASVNSLFLLKISETILRVPKNFVRSILFIPICSILNLMASIGSGASI